MRPTPTRHLLARLITAAIIALAWAPPATAQPPAPTVLVIDGSAAMLEVDDDQLTRIESVRQATTAVMARHPENTPLGAVTYGTTIAGFAANTTEGCTDVSTLAAPGDTTPSGVSTLISGIYPGGFAPMSAAITKAQTLLKGADTASIVVVASTNDPCSPTPVCEAAQKFKDNYPAVRINAIGFMANDDARRDLACLAAATGGIYQEATTAPTLASALDVALAGGLPPSSDAPVITPASKLEAPVVDPGTVDTPTRVRLQGPFNKGTTVYAKLNVAKDHILQVAVADPTGVAVNANLQLALVTGNGEVCHSATTALSAMNAALRSVPTGDNDESCPHGDLFLAIAGSHGAPAALDLAVAAIPTDDVKNAEEPTARTMADLSTLTPTPGQELTLTPDIGPNTPTASGTFTTHLLPGHSGYVAIPAGWGQNVDIQVEVLPPALDEAMGWAPQPTIGRPLLLELTNSLGQPVDVVGTTTLDTLSVGAPVTFGTAYAAAITNVGYNTSWHGGPQYLKVGVPARAATGLQDTYAIADQFQPVTVQVTIAAVGEVVAAPGPTEESSGSGSWVSALTTVAMTVGSAAVLVALVVGVGLLLSNKRPRKRRRWAERF